MCVVCYAPAIEILPIVLLLIAATVGSVLALLARFIGYGLLGLEWVCNRYDRAVSVIMSIAVVGMLSLAAGVMVAPALGFIVAGSAVSLPTILVARRIKAARIERLKEIGAPVRVQARIGR
ncbi:MAG: hypothetical protein JXA67_20425 [Micromonosporaceae bacterium]|nr:hypothetical protein [Micromonosporaceae bacterium]